MTESGRKKICCEPPRSAGNGADAKFVPRSERMMIAAPFRTPSHARPAIASRRCSNAGAPSLAVNNGSVVTFTNRDAVPHTVTADDGAVDSGIIQPGKAFKVTVSSRTRTSSVALTVSSRAAMQ